MSSIRSKKSLKRKSNDLTSVWKIRIILFSLGAILILPGIILNLKQPQKGTPSEANSFLNEPVKISPDLLKNKLTTTAPKKIIIPSLEIDIPVKVAQIIDGYWEVFEDSAGYGLGSGLPGEKGNMVIFAHARSGLFAGLKDIKPDEMVYILTNDKWFTYKVVKIKDVLPNDTQVIAPTVDETLTLYTCSGFADQKRLIVTAKRLVL